MLWGVGFLMSYKSGMLAFRQLAHLYLLFTIWHLRYLIKGGLKMQPFLLLEN